MTQKSKRIGIRLSIDEMEVLKIIGQSERFNGWSEIIRYLIRMEARRRKIWFSITEKENA